MIIRGKKIMVELGIAALIGMLAGIAGTIAATQEKKVAPAPVVVETHKGTEEAIKQLTALDLTQPLCSPEFIDQHGPLLCRELTCLQFTRGMDSQTAGDQCESISNIQNKIEIEKWCNQYQDQAFKQDCIDIFWKRN